MAILVVVVATFVYIYVTANFTSLILRLNTQLENYRTRLQGVDRYLARNRVSKELRSAVKRCGAWGTASPNPAPHTRAAHGRRTCAPHMRAAHARRTRAPHTRAAHARRAESDRPPFTSESGLWLRRPLPTMLPPLGSPLSQRRRPCCPSPLPVWLTSGSPGGVWRTFAPRPPQSPPPLPRSHFTHAFSLGSDDDQALLEQMPHSLRRAVLSDIYMATLRRTPIFFGCARLLRTICPLVRRSVCLSGDKLCKQGDVATELYVLESGHLKLTFSLTDDADDADEAIFDETDERREVLGDGARGAQGGGGGCGGSLGWNKMRVTHAASRRFQKRGESMDRSRHGGRGGDDLSRHGGSGGGGAAVAGAASRVPSALLANLNGSKKNLVASRALPASAAAPGAAAGRPARNSKERAQAAALAREVQAGGWQRGTGSTATVKELRMRGQVVGEPSFFFGVRQSCTAEAAEPSSCLVLLKSDFEHLAKDLPDELAQVSQRGRPAPAPPPRRPAPPRAAPRR